MSGSHSGNVQPGLDLEEHVGLALAKRVALVVQDTGGNWIQLTGLDLANGNPLGVALLDGSTGSPLTVRNPKLLAYSSLTSTYASMYAVPSGSKAQVKQIRAINEGSSNRTVSVGLRPDPGVATTTITWIAVLAAGESVDFLDEDLCLSSQNAIFGKQNSGTDVSYAINGEELT